MYVYNYWLTEGETIKHKKYGEGIIIKANNLDQVWAMQNLKTNEVKILGIRDLESMELISK